MSSTTSARRARRSAWCASRRTGRSRGPQILAAVKGAKQIAVIEKGGSFGAGGIMTPEVKEVLYDAGLKIPVSGFCVQLGGREVAPDGIAEIIERVSKGERQKAYEYFRIKQALLPDLVP